MAKRMMATIHVEAADLPEVKAVIRAMAESIERREQALYTAWTIIANAYVNASPGPETGWDAAPTEWREAAERWRDEQFHPLIGVPSEPVAGPDSSLLAWGAHLVDPGPAVEPC